MGHSSNELSGDQISQIVAFLLMLTDPCQKSRECLAPWVTDDLLPDPTGVRLNAVDAADNDL